MWDVFISYASEDKESVARPLAEALIKNRLAVWYDDLSLEVGESTRESIDEGIKGSKYGVIIFSRSYFQNYWTKKELNALIAREIIGKNKILPVWHDLSYEDMVELAPTLADPHAVKTSEGIEQVVNRIIKVVKPASVDRNIGTRFQPFVEIFASTNSILIGKSVTFSGKSVNGGAVVHLFAYGPGEYSNGLKIASPEITSSNTWKYEWFVGDQIEPGEYFIRAFDSQQRVSDDVPINIELGAITITAAGDGVCYIGEILSLSGTSTVPGKEIYLSIKKKGFFSKQKRIDQLDTESRNNDKNTFARVSVTDENTWSYKWDTASVAASLQKGYHLIYASEGPFVEPDFGNKAYSKIGIIIEQPFVSGTVASSILRKGDTVIIRGIAEGVSHQEVQIWIFGKQFYHINKIRTRRDALFSYELSEELMKKLPPDNYFVLIQHPMMNNKLDVYYDELTHCVLTDFPKKGTRLFSLQGPESLSGVDAAIAVAHAINNPQIDDTYTKLSFRIE